VGGLVEVEPVVEKKKTNTYKQVFDKNNLVREGGNYPTPFIKNI
jgi:hypothetical protein